MLRATARILACGMAVWGLAMTDGGSAVASRASTVAPQSADVSISATAIGRTVQPNENFDIALDVVNLGPSAATDITVVNELDDAFVAFSVQADARFTCTRNGLVLTCTIPQLGAAARALIEVEAWIAADAVDGRIAVSRARVTSSTDDPDASNDVAVATIEIHDPNAPTTAGGGASTSIPTTIGAATSSTPAASVGAGPTSTRRSGTLPATGSPAPIVLVAVIALGLGSASVLTARWRVRVRSPGSRDRGIERGSGP